ncbi:hypothetical protein [Flavobacterium caeni]|uniref:Cytochrome c domain-containing protein n=1 Tax=Flavobacterium caeni TaxID=490189 RepID=A0A1G5INV0_9FLAO|nr:hypothetical protein [Flavobacterium caeni]SCY77420.1 conserved hypothetical protein, HNE_0200 family [Flavobacterium caeni]
MKYNNPLRLLTLGLAFAFLVSCSDDDEQYVPIPPAVVTSPVVMDLTQVPYTNLSEYKFFDGDMKEQKPAYGVIPYQPASQLFTDYAEKKRFIWLPKNTKATYDADGKVLELPVGAALIKTFYYNRVQPSNTTKIIETRVMIRKESGWIFAEYVWNDAQTEATLSPGGNNVPLTWIDANDVTKSANYHIPSAAECFTCHNINEVNVPIGIKPQNLNWNYAYTSGTQNQLQKLIDFGYLEDTLPENIVSTVDFNDTSKPLELRARSYFDANCAHCHQDGGHAENYAMRFPFSQTENRTNMGVCVSHTHYVPGFAGRLVTPGDIDRSMVYYRLTTDEVNLMMPYLGRTILHDEAVALVAEWINSVTDCP